MTAIKQEDLIQSVADAFQYISYYHPLDYIRALGEAYEREESPAAKDAIAAGYRVRGVAMNHCVHRPLALREVVDHEVSWKRGGLKRADRDLQSSDERSVDL